MTLRDYRNMLKTDTERQRAIVLAAIKSCPSPFNKLHSATGSGQVHPNPFTYREPAILFYMQEIAYGAEGKPSHAWLFSALEAAQGLV